MFANLNYLAIAVTAVIYFFMGYLWFTPLFGKAWTQIVGVSITEEEKKKSMAMLFIGTFVYNFIICFATACVLYFISPSSVLGAVKTGLLLGIGIAAAPMAMNYMYAFRPFKLTLIDAGYHVVCITMASIILTMWR